MRWVRRAGVIILTILVSLPACGASRFLPRLRFRVLATAHFRIYFHPGEEPLARSLGVIAESVRATVPARLGLSAPAVTHVLLVDQDDESNGWATPLPYDTVMVTAAWPAASDLIGNTDDWLRMVFVHEYTHVLQLSQSRGWARIVGDVFGRTPLAFPNLFLPEWEVEGLATYEESRETGQGRLRGGDSSAIVRERVREAGLERLGAVSGGQVNWPGPLSPYLFGGFFDEYLATRFGEEKLGELARRSAGRLPFLASPAFRSTFGRSLGDLWKDYQHSLAEGGRDVPPSAGQTAVRLTHDGFYAETPRFVDDGRRLVYARRTPHGLPALVVLDAADPARARSRRLTTRYGGEQLGVAHGVVFYDQGDYEVNVAWRSDLYAADVATRRVQRLTRGARLLAPDVSSDGRHLACLEIVEGIRRLVVFRVAGTRVGEIRLERQPVAGTERGAIYGSPRWSPDGRRIAVERRRPGGPSELVVANAETGDERVIVTSAARNVSPAWLPDGRTLLFASDRGGSFQVYAVSADGGNLVRVTSVPGGALSPEPSCDGSRVVYVGYTAAGYDLFETALDVGRAIADADTPNAMPPTPAGASETNPASRSSAPTSATAGSAVQAYSPFFTLLPRAWSPAADTYEGDVRLGAATGGVDVLGRHSFGVAALWRVEGGAGAVRGPHRARPDWSAFYQYDRWRPAFYVTGSQDTSFLPTTVRGVRVADSELLETNASLGVSVPFVHAGYAHLVQGAFNYERDTLTTVAGDRGFHRNAARAAWLFTNAHEFGYSISPEQGVTLGATSEQVRAALGADGDADAFTGEVRGYLRLGGRHSVLAARAGLGVAHGDASVRRVFYLGGPGPLSSPIDFGSEALNLLRGYEDKAFAGGRVAVANVDYRVPLWRIERGRGTWPIFIRTVHGALFADAGQAWDGSFRWSGTVGSVGGELSIDTVLGFGLPLTVSAGVARPWAAQEGRVGRGAVYVRVGRAF